MSHRVELKVTFLAPEQGGRGNPLSLNGYRPHLRVPPDGSLLGVEFLGSGGIVPVGSPVSVMAALLYGPAVSYAALQPGLEVEVLEGSRVVGQGRVLGLT